MTIETSNTKATAWILVSMAEIIGPSALTCGVMSEKSLAIFAVSALGFVAAVLVGFWLVLGLAA
jgi:hypothetical protein